MNYRPEVLIYFDKLEVANISPNIPYLPNSFIQNGSDAFVTFTEIQKLTLVVSF